MFVTTIAAAVSVSRDINQQPIPSFEIFPFCVEPIADIARTCLALDFWNLVVAIGEPKIFFRPKKLGHQAIRLGHRSPIHHLQIRALGISISKIDIVLQLPHPLFFQQSLIEQDIPLQ